MKFFSRVSIRARFHWMIGIVTVSLLATAAVNAVSDRASRQGAKQVLERSTAALSDGAELRETVSQMRRLESAIIAIGSSNTLEVGRLAKDWQQAVTASQKVAERIAESGAQNGGGDEVKALTSRHSKLVADYAALIKPVAAQLQAAQIDGAVALAYAGRAEDTVKQMQANVEALTQLQLAQVAAIQAQAEQRAAMADGVKLALMAILLALFLPLAWLTLRAVCGPLDRVIVVAERIAQGDLGSTIETGGQNEIGRLLHAMAGMQGRLKALVGEIRSTADSIQLASAEVAAGNADLSRRTEEQASNLQRAASSMEDLNSTVQRNADGARQACDLAGAASAVAAKGGEAVNRVVTRMTDISASSKKMAEIVGVIEGIAFQTNILALNAAVEAARAGEQGRGFAVVAGEVQTLARSSAEAAKEIKNLIGSSVAEVDAGAALVADAGATMGDIVAQVSKVNSLIAAISAATVHQTERIALVSTAVTHLDSSTQHNAALVEQSAAAADSLRQLAERLVGAVAVFKLGQGVV